MSYLVDTNVISELLKNKPDNSVTEWFQRAPSESLYLSVLTLGEIRNGIERLDVSIKKNKLILWLEQDLPNWFENRILSIDAQTAERWGYIVAKAPEKVPAIDSLIAATALVHNLKIVTRNTKDFKTFPDLEIINPWQ